MKRVFLKAAGFGTGFALAIIAAIGLFAYVSSLPRPVEKWNENAVTASFVELTSTTGENVVLDFSFALDNTTDHDYTLPNEKDSLYVETPRGKGLYQYNNSPDPYLQNVTIGPSFIPSKRRVIVTLHLTYTYNESYPKAGKQNTEKMHKYMATRLERIDGLKVFDKAKRYQINLPNGWKK